MSLELRALATCVPRAEVSGNVYKRQLWQRKHQPTSSNQSSASRAPALATSSTSQRQAAASARQQQPSSVPVPGGNVHANVRVPANVIALVTTPPATVRHQPPSSNIKHRPSPSLVEMRMSLSVSLQMSLSMSPLHQPPSSTCQRQVPAAIARPSTWWKCPCHHYAVRIGCNR